MTSEQFVVDLLALVFTFAGFVLAVAAPLAGKMRFGWPGLLLSFVVPLSSFLAAEHIADGYHGTKCREAHDCTATALLIIMLVVAHLHGMGLWLVSAVLVAAYPLAVATRAVFRKRWRR